MTADRVYARALGAALLAVSYGCVLLASHPASAQSRQSPLQLRPTLGAPDAPAQAVEATETDDELATGAITPSGPAPSRIGNIPVYEAPAATGASETGFDSLNRADRGETPSRRARAADADAAQPSPRDPALPPRAGVGRTPISPSVAGTFPGQPPRRRLRPEPEPFGQVGFYVGTFLAKAAVELSGGYSTNPGRFASPRGSAFYLIAPELLIASDWSRHSLTADLRGSFTGYGTTFPPSTGSPGPTSIDRPDFTGLINGRLDVTRDSRVIGEFRSRIGTDNPGSPDLQAGLAEYPLFFSNGVSLGFEQDFNRFRVAASATADRTTYENSKLTNGVSASNADRNVSRYGGIGRASYEINPALRPFVEIQGDSRIHDSRMDRNGFLRDSSGGYIKVGSTFELTRLISGEAAIGYLARNYDDPRLRKIDGILTSGSLIWRPSGLTTLRLTATSSIDETTLPGVSGVKSNGYVVQVDHDFRRWLTGSLRFGYATSDYDGSRFDKNYSIGGDLVYRMSRDVHLKASVRHDWLDSSIPVANTRETVMMLGVRLQR